MAHTPGPWEMSGPDEPACVRTVREYVELIADGSRPRKDSKGRPQKPYKKTIYDPMGVSLWPRYWSDLAPTTIDNARLIAAAPDLLAECKLARDILKASGVADPVTIERLTRVIDKAEGRP
jgi:hypothetical protein